MYKLNSKSVREKINCLRVTCASGFLTNYFMTPLENKVFYRENEKALVFLQKEKSFYKLYFAAIDLTSLERLLIELPQYEIYLELISRTPPGKRFAEKIEKFFDYKTTYRKLYKKLSVSESKIRPVCKTDADLIYDKIYKTFDIRFEHLMEKGELIHLIKENNVLTVYEDDEMKSFLVYKKQGSKAYLNHIANFGSKENLLALWKIFYESLNSDGIKYLDLWYDTKNKKAENMYRIEQFQPLNMFNYCYKKI